jgi:hypothetical protein
MNDNNRDSEVKDKKIEQKSFTLIKPLCCNNYYNNTRLILHVDESVKRKNWTAYNQSIYLNVSSAKHYAW